MLLFIIESFGLSIYGTYELVKEVLFDFADEGYIYVKKDRSLLERILTTSIFLIPGINMAYIIYVAREYRKNPIKILNDFKEKGLLTKMSKKDNDLYQHDRSFATLLNLINKYSISEPSDEPLEETVEESPKIEFETDESKLTPRQKRLQELYIIKYNLARSGISHPFINEEIEQLKEEEAKSKKLEI